MHLSPKAETIAQKNRFIRIQRSLNVGGGLGGGEL